MTQKGLHIMGPPFSFKTAARLAAAVLVLLSAGVQGCSQKTFHPPVTPLAVAGEPAIPTAYLIGAGDELEILYYIDPEVSVPEYRIDSEDVLRVDFFYYPVMSKTVSVRPDGFITLPSVGDVKARNKKPADLAKEISELFKPLLSQPLITVEVLEFNAKIEELKRAIYNQERGMSRLAVVRADGCISLPYIGDVPAAGLTAHDLRERLHQRYQKIIHNLSATVVVLRAHSNRIYVMGEVQRPNFYEIMGPTTLTQALAMAGGFTREAKSDQVIVVRRDKNGQPSAHIVYAHQIIGRDSLVDPLIQQYDVIFVPRSALAQTALTADYLWRIIPLRFNVSYVWQQDLNE